MTVGPDVVDVLIDDHREIERLIAEIAQDGGHDERWLSVSVAELTRHLTVEEEYVYPLVREVVPHGDRMAGDAVTLDEEAEQLMRRLEDAGGAPTVAQLEDVVRRHVELTEAHLFPALRASVAPDQLDHLAGVVQMAKRTAPTHPHPGAPQAPPWNQILAPGIGLVDRVRDALKGRATKREDLS